MFDPAVEPPIPLASVPSVVAWLPRRAASGKRVSVQTLYRWAFRGLNGHRLETLRCGGMLCTSEAALRRFFAKLSAPAGTAGVPDLAAAAEQAERELDAAGI